MNTPISTPQVSVVMSVYNGEGELRVSLDSVLDQDGCDLELIVVNDGSTDSSAECLESYARRDPRVRVIHQENRGLTAALCRGCSAATGKYIARQDVGDRSLGRRFAEQASFLDARPECVIVAGGTEFVAPDGERMYAVVPSDPVVGTLDRNDVRFPPLLSAMFRRDAYTRVGGFREQFRVAQDIDLWLRISEAGDCRALPSMHYQVRWSTDGISSRRRAEQLRFVELAVAAARLRRSGSSDAQLVEQARSWPVSKRSGQSDRAARARANYFVGSCLSDSNPEAANRYYRRALRENPLHLKSLLRVIAGPRASRGETTA
jgi:glycosyltransferase involved in cell wall biosynthesis